MRCRCIKNFKYAGLIYFSDSEFVYRSSLMGDGRYAYFIYGDNNFMRDEKMWYRLYDKEFYEYFYSLGELRREKLEKVGRL